MVELHNHLRGCHQKPWAQKGKIIFIAHKVTQLLNTGPTKTTMPTQTVLTLVGFKSKRGRAKNWRLKTTLTKMNLRLKVTKIIIETTMEAF